MGCILPFRRLFGDVVLDSCLRGLCSIAGLGPCNTLDLELGSSYLARYLRQFGTRSFVSLSIWSIFKLEQLLSETHSILKIGNMQNDINICCMLFVVENGLVHLCVRVNRVAVLADVFAMFLLGVIVAFC